MNKILFSLLFAPLFVLAGNINQEIKESCRVVAQQRDLHYKHSQAEIEAYCMHLMIRYDKTCQEACSQMMSDRGLVFSIKTLARHQAAAKLGSGKRSVGKPGSVTTQHTLNDMTSDEASESTDKCQESEKRGGRYSYAKNSMAFGDFLPASLK